VMQRVLSVLQTSNKARWLYSKTPKSPRFSEPPWLFESAAWGSAAKNSLLCARFHGQGRISTYNERHKATGMAENS
jgi:hypothetical protein